MNVRYRVELGEVERGELRAMLSGGKRAARKLKRAQILLAADAGVADETVAISLDVGVSTVSRVKRRFVEGGVVTTHSEEEWRLLRSLRRMRFSSHRLLDHLRTGGKAFLSTMFSQLACLGVKWNSSRRRRRCASSAGKAS